jgi:hypothetical protein
MREVHIDRALADKWQGMAHRLSQMSNLVEECRLVLLLELGITDPEHKALKVVDKIADAVNGQSYMFTPQSEWTGGENFKIRAPHICDGDTRLAGVLTPPEKKA